MRECSLDQCDRELLAKGLCRLHYGRVRRSGSPDEPNHTLPPEERFWAKVERVTGYCWLWTGAFDSNGYGHLGSKGKTVKAHRVSYELRHGPIPKGLWVLHHCDNPPCVNPEHLFLGTAADNMADRDAKGRQARGERNGSAKLTDSHVLAIREFYADYGLTVKELADKFGVSRQHIGDIINRKRWTHLTQQNGG